MRILFLSPRQCWPTQGGAKLRDYHFAQALARNAELTYLYFTDPGSPPLTTVDLPFCRDVIGIPKPQAYAPVKLFQGIVGRWPLLVLNYTSAEMSAAVERLTSADAYDLIHVDSTQMMRYGESLSGTGHRVLYNWHNIESEAMQRYSTTVSSPARSWYARVTASKVAAVENSMLKSAFGHVVCSEREHDVLRGIAPNARIAVIENGVDVESFSSAAAGSPTPTIVFVGLMNYHANVDAATSFARVVWPLLRKQIPDLRLSIVGAQPAPAVLELGKMEGITVTGTVPDVRPYYRDAMAAVVPLRVGGGTRLKILEAMAAGVPVISTTLGAEGLAVTPGENILIAEQTDADAWIGHLNRLKRDETERRRLTAAALHLVRSRYDWQLLGRTLRTTYEDWLRGSA